MLLPFSLLCPFLLFTAHAVPVVASCPELTPTTFSKTIEHGLWFVELYSPYCGHCKHFKPTWDKLVTEAEQEFPQVQLATVNCVLHGDLCDKNGVNGYPSLFMYEDGKKIDEFKSSRDLEPLREFIKRHVKETPKKEANETTSSYTTPPKPLLNLHGEVLTLSSENFSETLSKGPAFVKFFAPWCGHCKKLAPTWKQLAKHMQGNVTIADVDCVDHPGLCKTQGIQGYPTLVWFAQEDSRSEYNGGRKLEQLRAFVEKASAAGVQVLEKNDDLDEHIAAEEVVYLLLHQPSEETIMQSVREASVPLLGSPSIFASSSSDLFTRFSIPSTTPWAIIAIKDHDASVPPSVLYGVSSSQPTDSDVRHWLLTHRIPTSLELTQDNFQKVMNAPQAPLVVIAAANEVMKDKVGQRLRDVAKKWRVRTEGSGVVHGREVVWTVMDKTKWANWLKSMYGIKDAGTEGAEARKEHEDLDDVRVVIADHSKLIYYDSDRSGLPIKFMSSSSLFTSVEDAASGKTPYKNSENFVERLARKLNNQFQVVEKYLANHPFRSLFFALTVIVAFIYFANRFISGEANANPVDEWKELKGKNGRLD